jgi:hypothetical protein
MNTCVIKRGPNGLISDVFAPNGKRSILFANAYKLTNDAEKALRIWATAYTSKFKLRYGDWEGITHNITLDSNGEPLLKYLVSLEGEVRSKIDTDFPQWYSFKSGANQIAENSVAKAFMKKLEKMYPDFTFRLDPVSPTHSRLVYVPTEKIFDYSTDKSDIERAKREINPVLDKLLPKFPGMTYEWIKPSDLKQSEHERPIKQVNSFVRNNKVYLVEGRVSLNDGIEEFMHVFLEMLKKDRPSLFTGLFENAIADELFHADYEATKSVYGENHPSLKSEFLAKILTKAMRKELLANPDGRPNTVFGKLIQRFLDWIASLFDLKTISPKDTLKELAAYINTEDITIPLPDNDYLYYSIEPDSSDPNNDIDPDDRDSMTNITPRYKRKTARELNIEKAEKQLVKLKRVKEKARGITKDTVDVLDALIKNTEDQLEALNNGEETISVSKYKGSQDSESSDKTITKLGATFGEFEHALMEEIIMESLETGQPPIIAFTNPEFFDKFFKENEDFLALLNSYDKNMLRNIGLQVASYLNEFHNEGMMLIPETGLGVRDVDGKMVLGRLDVMAVDKRGFISVVDLKTKFSKVKPGPGFPTGIFNRIFEFKGDFKNGVAYEFEGFRAMSPLNQFHLQLAIYSEMLKKIGIKVNEDRNEILALAYNLEYEGETAGESESFDLTGYNIRKFNYGDMANDESKYKAIQDAAAQRFNPRAAEETQQEGPLKETDNPFDRFTEDAKNRIIEGLTKLSMEQIELIQREIEKTEDNKEISVSDKNAKVSELRKRMASIIRIRESLTKGALQDPTFNKALIIKQSLDVFANEIETMREIIKSIDVPSTYELNNIEHSNELKRLQENTAALDNMAYYIEAFVNTIRSMELDRETSDTITSTLTAMLNDIDNVTIDYVKAGKKVMKAVIMKTIGPKTFMKVFGDMRKILKPKLAWIERTIAQIESGEKSADSISFRAGRVIKNFFSANKNNATRLEELKQEREKITRIMNMADLNVTDSQVFDEALDEYLEGILNNPDGAGFYMGSTMGSNLDPSALISGSLNSEMAISAITQFLRNTYEQGKIEAADWAYALELDQTLSKFVDKMGGIEAANKAITEEVDKSTMYDENGQPLDPEKYRQFLNPVLQSFYDKHDFYIFMLRKLKQSSKDLTVQINEESSTVTKQLLTDQRKEVNAQIDALSTEFTQWLITETETRVKPEVMLLMKGSGEFNAEITELLEEMHQIINDAKGEEMLSESDQNRIDEIEAKISRIREKMLQEDPSKSAQMKQLLDYFQFDLNYNLWTIKREQIVRENDPVKLANWDRNNSDFMPTQEWQDIVSDIFSKIEKIQGQDPEVKEILDQISSIKRRNKVRGKFNFKYMNDADIEEYQALVSKLDDLREEKRNNPNTSLTEEQKEQLDYLYEQLSSIRKRELSETYTKERDRLRTNVVNAYAVLMDAERKVSNAGTVTNEMRNQVSAARNQYERAEDEFATFHNRNNTTTYQLGQDIIAKKKPLKEAPKSYLYEYIPVSKKHMELVPNKRYKIRRLKESAYNPNYQQSFVKNRQGKGVYPMPKGIRFNSATNTFDVQPGSKYANPRFLEMQRNDTAHDFYKLFVVENFLLKQKDASGQPLGFNYPFQEQQALDNVMSKGVGGVSREIKEKIQEISYANSEYEKATNESGMAGRDKVRFRENSAMPADLTTTNGISAIVAWNNGYYANKALAVAGIELDSAIYYLESIKSKLSGKKQRNDTGMGQASEEKASKIQQIIDQVKFEKRKFVNGQLYNSESNPNKIFNRKSVRMLMRLASFGRMAFDVSMQFGNLLSGNVQAFLSTCETRHATQSDYLEGKKLLYGRWFPKMVADFGKISDVSLETMIFRYMNPLGKIDAKYIHGAGTSRARKIGNTMVDINELSMVIQDKGETEIGLQTMLMIMNHYKYELFETDSSGNIVLENGMKKIKKDADGNTVYVSAIEVFAKKDGRPVLREDVNISIDDINTLKNTIQDDVQKFQGNYSDYTKTRAGGTLLGSLYEFYRKYLIPSISTRFSFGGYEGVGSAYSWSTQEAYVGYWTLLGKMCRYYGLGKTTKAVLYDTLLPGFAKKNIKLSDDLMTEEAEYYRTRSAMAAREILAGIAMLMLYNALRASLYDNDDDDLSYSELMMMRSLVKMSNETRSMIPLPIVGKPGDYIDNFGQFTSAFREGKTIWDGVEHGLYYVDYQFTGDDYAYQKGFYQKDTPRFEKGDAKIWKNLSDLTGYSNIVDVFSPYEAAKSALKNK